MADPKGLFDERVKELLDKESDRERIFEILRFYQSGQDLLRLLTDLRDVLDEPSKLELYEFLRPLVLLRHQIAYSRRIPTCAGSSRLRAVRLQRRVGESLGFAVRGGYEHGTGVFVTDVAPGSQADRQGLKVGDEIVRVNGFTISEAVHDDVLRLIRSRDDITLKVKYVGMVPQREEVTESVTWKYVDDLNNFSDAPLQTRDDSAHARRVNRLKIFIDCTGHASIGCSIVSESGPAARYPGIFVERVREGSLAEQVGLKPGDQILEVNGTSFKGITWKEALLALKSSRQLHFIIKQNNLAAMPPRQELEQEVTQPAVTSPAEDVPHHTPDLPVETPILAPPTTVVPPSVVTEPALARRQNNNQGQDGRLEEAEIVLHQLNLRSQQSSAVSMISTSAQVHTTHNNNTVNDRLARSGNTSRKSVEDGSFPLGGAAAAKLERQRRESTGKGSNSPRLLEVEGEFGWTDRVPAGIYQKVPSDVLRGRPLKCLTYRKTSDLGISVEGGAGSPLSDKILVSVVYDDGVARRSGKLHVGDQLIMMNSTKLLGLSATEAEKVINDTSKDGDAELIYCESTLINDEDSVTYF